MKKEHPGVPGGGALRAKEAMELIMMIVILVCGFIAIAFVLLITVYLIISGLPAIREVGLTDFLFGTRWASTDKTDPAYGILPFILTSIYGTAGAILIGVPIGFLTAVFLSKVAPPRVAAVIRPAVDLLAGIPSIVYGIFGMLFFVQLFGWGTSVLSGALTMALMILPLVMRTTEEALKAVPDSFREGSFALGAGKLRTIFKIILPSAMSGIISGVILSLGRIVGETAALIYTAGTATNVAGGFLKGGETLSIHVYILATNALYEKEAWAAAVVLIALVLVINGLAEFVGAKLKKEY